MLRNYQTNTVKLLNNNNNNNQLVVLPTGSGKTVIFTEYVKNNQTNKILVLTDRKQLFKQITNTFNYNNIIFNTINQQEKIINQNITITIAMVETFKRNINIYKELKFDTIIIDEAHMSCFNKILDIFKESKKIGFTATPLGNHLKKYYTQLIQPIDTIELIEQGYLAKCKAYQMIDDFSDLNIDKFDFSNESNFNHFNKKYIYDGLINEYNKICKNKKTIIFCVNIEHAKITCQHFNNNNILAYYISSETKQEERELIEQKYNNNEFDVLINCEIFTKGYDNPNIECVIINRATNSLALWLQMIGRGSRITETKKEFILLDFGGNHSRLGIWDENRTWNIKKQINKKNNNIKPIYISCPFCNSVLHILNKNCHNCNNIISNTEIIMKKGILVKVNNNLKNKFKNIQNIIGKN